MLPAGSTRVARLGAGNGRRLPFDLDDDLLEGTRGEGKLALAPVSGTDRREGVTADVETLPRDDPRRQQGETGLDHLRFVDEQGAFALALSRRGEHVAQGRLAERYFAVGGQHRVLAQVVVVEDQLAVLYVEHVAAAEFTQGNEHALGPGIGTFHQGARGRHSELPS